jgi:Flp pilus assembly protein TadG
MRLFKASKQGQRRTRSERGQILVEFALVATAFFLFLFGIFDFARMFQSWITVQHSAREAARYAITGLTACDGVTASRTTCIVQTAEDGTLGLPDGGIGSSLVTVTYEFWDYQNNGTWSSTAASGAGGPCDAIEVEVIYQHSFITPFVKPVMSILGANPISLHGTQRMTNEPWGSCAPVATVSSGATSPPGGTGSSPPDTPTPAPTATSPPTATPPPTATSPPTATAVPTATSPPTATPTNEDECKWWQWWC